MPVQTGLWIGRMKSCAWSLLKATRYAESPWQGRRGEEGTHEEKWGSLYPVCFGFSAMLQVEKNGERPG